MGIETDNPGNGCPGTHLSKSSLAALEYGGWLQYE